MAWYAWYLIQKESFLYSVIWSDDIDIMLVFSSIQRDQILFFFGYEQQRDRKEVQFISWRKKRK